MMDRLLIILSCCDIVFSICVFLTDRRNVCHVAVVVWLFMFLCMLCFRQTGVVHAMLWGDIVVIWLLMFFCLLCFRQTGVAHAMLWGAGVKCWHPAPSMPDRSGQTSGEAASSVPERRATRGGRCERPGAGPGGTACPIPHRPCWPPTHEHKWTGPEWHDWQQHHHHKHLLGRGAQARGHPSNQGHH